ncbi:MAG: GWxTD domain-containing protein [Acidobacteria bacterium]|jgi:GWxTD domain-containing protein|nr:GWxTD domain-containing protein [Acidobacteriota bacterium]
MNRHALAPLAKAGIAMLLLGVAFPGFAARLDPDSEDFFHMTRHFMTRDEEKVFRGLTTPEFRREFIAAFWVIRDPDPETEENEFRTELETRFEFVNKHLREANRPGWDTARGMIYMVLGPPTMMNAGTTSSTLSASSSNPMPNSIVWPYGETGIRVWFIDNQGYGVYDLDMMRTSPRLLELLKRARTQLIQGDKGAEENFLGFTAEFAPAASRLLIAVEAKDLRFDTDGAGGFTARLHLAANIYMPDGTIVTRKEDRRLAVDAEMQKKKRLALDWALPLGAGKYQVDLLVLDRVGGRSNRQFLSLKIK